MSYHSRKIFTPGASRKRKEREPFCYSPKPSIPTSNERGIGCITTTSFAKAAGTASSNRLLAGYMAHEFLTKGTLMGQKFDPARAEAAPLSAIGASTSAVESRKMKPGQSLQPEQQSPSYAEVATLLKSDGAHIPGIVNPSQLAGWIQM